MSDFSKLKVKKNSKEYVLNVCTQDTEQNITGTKNFTKLTVNSKNIVRSVNGVDADTQGNVQLDGIEVDDMVLGEKGYIRYKNGLQLCWEYSTDLITTSTTVNLVKPFYDNNYALIGPGFCIVNKGRQMITNKTATSFSTGSHTEATGTQYYLAIGRWK